VTGSRLRARVTRAEVAVKCPTCGQSVVRIRERLELMADTVLQTLPEHEAKRILEAFKRIWNS
jgi:hypothetical protein